jgi:carbon-monoxide dehydrogenase medium subunit
VAVQIARDPSGRVATARIALLGVGEGPVLARTAAAALVGQLPSAEALRAAAEAVSADLDPHGPHGDVHATPMYRRHLARVLVGRALADACALSEAAR